MIAQMVYTIIHGLAGAHGIRLQKIDFMPPGTIRPEDDGADRAEAAIKGQAAAIERRA